MQLLAGLGVHHSYCSTVSQSAVDAITSPLASIHFIHPAMFLKTSIHSICGHALCDSCIHVCDVSHTHTHFIKASIHSFIHLVLWSCIHTYDLCCTHTLTCSQGNAKGKDQHGAADSAAASDADSATIKPCTALAARRALAKVDFREEGDGLVVSDEGEGTAQEAATAAAAAEGIAVVLTPVTPAVERMLYVSGLTS